MRRYHRFFFALLILAALFNAACQRQRSFQIEEVPFEKGLDGCKPGAENCTYLKLAYPRLSGGPKDGRVALNAEILRFVLNPENDKDSQAKDGEAAAAGLISDYQKFKQEFPKTAQVWSQERQVKVLANSPKVFSLSLENSEYMGGAHPNSTQDYRSYDPKTGRRYTLADWLKPGFQGPLNALGEKAFRQARGLPAGAGLNDAGFTFESGFKLNDNFAATPEGLIFYFNPYEVASYADGPTEVKISYSELKGWLKPDGPLSARIR